MIVRGLRKGLGQLILFGDWLTRPRPIQRRAEEQLLVDESAQGVSLYQFYACPFCVKTRRAIRRLNVPVETRDALRNQQRREELLAGGGEIKVPCLRIDGPDSTTWMYESSEIISYLKRRFDPDSSDYEGALSNVA